MIEAFNQLSQPITNNSELTEFLSTYFGQAGSELEEVPEEELETDPTFLEDVNDPVVADFVRQVIDIWPDLTRRYAGGGNCTECVDSFLEVNRTFVIAGGRFREPYYWDSFWIIEGLLRTQGSFTEIARNIIENFLDFVEDFGFVPNGARVYYLNRSQPPLLTAMVSAYVEYTGDESILERALPLLEKELDFWMTNRTVTVETSAGHVTLNRYNVENNQPRPESYREDYVTANNESYYASDGTIYPEREPLTDEEKATLYRNLASGAESGWDYSSKWLRTPLDAAEDTYFPLRSLNVIETVPVELNSILYLNEMTISQLYRSAGNAKACADYASRAARRSDAMFELMWNETYSSYFDYNLTSSSQNVFQPADENADEDENDTRGAPEGYQVRFTPAQYYPFWTGAAPEELRNDPSVVRQAYGRVEALLDRKAGAIAASNFASGQQWDEPNVWPPLQYILIKGLLNTGRPGNNGNGKGDGNNKNYNNYNNEDYAWTQTLALRLAQRYLDSTFCTWRATGGATPELPQLEGAQANGTIFEKYADNATNVAGGGGEYEVVEGFGWTNGVLIWVADLFGEDLVQPDCGNITAAEISEKRRRDVSAVELHKRDLQWIKRFN